MHPQRVTVWCRFWYGGIIGPFFCDLIPLDYILWGAVKDTCYTNHLETIEALQHEIEVAIHGIDAQTIENVLKIWVDRMGYCKASRGSHLNDVVFHF